MTETAPHTASDPHEVPFGFEELFFSRTDAGGIIQFGNSVFQRISAYDWDELLGKPHKLVRHPDTPRAVFWLLWSTIQQGLPIGAFVKNRAKDGRHYWVFAIVTPVEGGYLSVRLRPSSAFFDIIAREYPGLAALERREGLAPAASAPLLADKLKALGYDEYATFMAAALGAELKSRDAQLGRARDHTLAQFDDLLAAAQSLLRQTDIIRAAYDQNENTPFNFRVLAAQLGQEGAAIGVISSNYSVLSDEMRAILDQFVAAARDVFAAVNDGYFLACTARVQRELLEFFRKEKSAGPLPRDQEMALLDQQQSEYGARAQAGLLDISRKAKGFRQTCLEMNRLAAGLEVMRVMGKVECARHALVKDRMDELLNDLEHFQKAITAALKEIEQMNRLIEREADQLLTHARQAA